MNTSGTSLEDLYARLTLEDEEDGGVVVAEGEVQRPVITYVLMGRFVTDKNINFNAMQNVLAALWRPKEGMEVYDIGGHRYSFVFYHMLDLQKVLDGGPWTFEQNLLVYHCLKDNEDPHLVSLNSMDIWVQVYDLPKEMVSDSILRSIGNYVGSFVKADPANISGGWRMYMRVRVTMDISKPLKRRMKIKREGGDWSWINFKYERLSMFCFVCGLIGHSERDCGIIYANPEKEVPRAYGVWLRAPTKNSQSQNLGAKWLRSATDGGQTWKKEGDVFAQSTTMDGGARHGS